MKTLRTVIIGCCTFALLATVGCQLNDHDSADPAPDEPVEEGASPARAGAATGGRRPDGAAGDAGSGGTSNGSGTSNTNGDASLGNADGSLGTGGDSGFPTLPLLDAGMLTPPNFGATDASGFLGSPDAASLSDATLSPNG